MDNTRRYIGSKTRLLNKPLMIFLILVVPILFIFFPLIRFDFWGLFSAPWIIIIETLLILAVSYTCTLTGLLIKTKRMQSWKIARFLFLLTFLIWFGLFVACALCFFLGLFGIQMVSSKIQFPIKNVLSIDIDAKGQIYCAEGMYSRLQIFDNNGQFLRGWFIPAKMKSESWGFFVDKNNHVCVIKGNKKYTYNSEGRLLSIAQKPDDIKDYLGYQRHNVQDISGNSYTSVTRFFIPWKLIKSNGQKKSLLISEPIGLWFVGVPFPWVGFIILSLLPGIILDWKIKPYEILQKHSSKNLKF